MSSLVQAKWVSSARLESSSAGASAVRRFLRKYSTALTSWTVTALDLGELVDLVGAEVVDDRPQRGDLVVGRARARPGTTPWLVWWISHSTSTCTRCRLSAASERWSTSGATAPR